MTLFSYIYTCHYVLSEESEEKITFTRRKHFTMESTRIPVGFRFRPNSIELLIHYLLKRVKRKPLPCDSIIECDLYNNSTEEWWEILKNSEAKEIYCFTKLKKKGHGGSNKDRVSKSGTWKGTQKTKEIYVHSKGHDDMHVGSKRAFRFMPKSSIGFEIDGKVLMDEYQLACDLLHGIESPVRFCTFYSCQVVFVTVLFSLVKHAYMRLINLLLTGIYLKLASLGFLVVWHGKLTTEDNQRLLYPWLLLSFNKIYLNRGKNPHSNPS